jgi:hypothetical protein
MEPDEEKKAFYVLYARAVCVCVYIDTGAMGQWAKDTHAFLNRYEGCFAAYLEVEEEDCGFYGIFRYLEKRLSSIPT